MVKTKEEKGKFSGTDKEKVEILKECAALGAEYIDVAFHTEQKHLKDLIKNKFKSKIIISYHNFEKTPSIKALRDIENKIIRKKGDMIKIATMAKKEEDIVNLTKFALELKKKRKKFIIIGMGKKGKITRLLAPQLGSEIMYAPLKNTKSSASGQVEAGMLREFWRNALGNG